VSNKFSIAAVLGLAAVPLLPQLAASTIRAGNSKADIGPVEVVRSKPVPITEAPLLEPSPQVAARRTRERAERAKEKSEPAAPEKQVAPPQKEPSGASQGSGEKTPILPAENKSGSDTKADTAQPEPPKPDVWSDAEIITALRECVRLLAPIAAEIEVSQPVKHEQCGAPAPVLLRRIGSGANKVEISPPAMVNCAMVASLHSWVERTLQPAAQDTLGSPIARLRNASGYACRNRNGSQHSADRLSEHALANAIDIAGFVTADGRTIDVVRDWGPTVRDQREAERVAAAQAKDGKSLQNLAKKETADRTPSGIAYRADDKRETEKAAAALAKEAPDRKPSGIAHKADDQHKEKKATLQTAELRKLGRGAGDVRSGSQAVPAPRLPERIDAKKSAEAMFLRRLHKGACGTFGTVLGPEANEAHRSHFHFDLAPRRRSAFCE
jgi:hypothetical protein